MLSYLLVGIICGFFLGRAQRKQHETERYVRSGREPRYLVMSTKYGVQQPQLHEWQDNNE